MTSHIYTAAQAGFNALLIDVECDMHKGLPSINIVGLGNKAIDEAKERLRSAIANSGLVFPRKRIVVNLAPADIPKDGSSFDVAMALAILISNEQLSITSDNVISKSLFIGELSLDGKLRPVRGVISLVETANRAKLEYVFIPRENQDQARLVKGVHIVPIDNLGQLIRLLQDTSALNEITRAPYKQMIEPVYNGPDFSEIRGQTVAKRALLIAAAGHHNILLNGPPGAGKTMMAKALVSILTKPSSEEIIEITKLHSLAGEAISEVVTSRPFRSPHHTTSTIALIGGGRIPIPGEISLAHRGVLFLDELPEYSRSSLEALRQPLEDSSVHIARAHLKAIFPANFILVATQNPCPCGFLYDDNGKCTCSNSQILQYQKKLSGPLLDRIDLNIFVNRVEHRKLLENHASISSESLRHSVNTADERQNKRFGNGWQRNAHMTNKQIKTLARLDKNAVDLLNQSADNLQLSARSYMKTIKVARTIADVEDSEDITAAHLAEALQYRSQPLTI